MVTSLLAGAFAVGILLLIIRWAGGISQLWSAMDISDNIAKFKRGLRDIDDGPTSFIHAVAYFLISIVLGYLTWVFDLSSSWEYSEHLRTLMLKTSGSFALSVYLIAVVTYLPTLIELFGARFAQFGVLWAQLLVVGLAAFDLFTDRQRVVEFIQPYYGSFVSPDNPWALNIVFKGLYYVVFSIWWVLASYGFEAAFVCFLFATGASLGKGFIGLRRNYRPLGPIIDEPTPRKRK